MWMIVSIFSSLSSITPPPTLLVPGTIKRIHFNFFIQCTNMFLNPLYKYQPVWIFIFFSYLLFFFAKHLCLNFEPHSNTLALESTVWTKRYSAFNIQYSAFANISHFQYYKKKSVKIYLTQLFGPKSPNYLKRHRWNWIAHG